VYEVSQDPAIQRNLTEVFAPYRMEHAAHFVRQQTRAAWDEGRRAEFLVADAATGTRLGRVGLDLRPHEPGAAEIGYWTASAARGRGVATAAGPAPPTCAQWFTHHTRVCAMNHCAHGSSGPAGAVRPWRRMGQVKSVLGVT
jgi:GNAT acetyltransferase-like protein